MGKYGVCTTKFNIYYYERLNPRWWAIASHSLLKVMKIWWILEINKCNIHKIVKKNEKLVYFLGWAV